MKRLYNDSISLTFPSSLLPLLLLVIAAFSAKADMVTVDFRQLYTEESPENLSSSAILRYLNSNESTAGIVEAIPYAKGTYGYVNGLNKYEQDYKESYGYSKNDEGYGALFITATDSISHEDIGGLTIRIAPKYRHKNTNLNLYLFKDIHNLGSSGSTTDTYLEVSINGGEYQQATISRSDAYCCTFNIRPEGEIIRELSLRVPNPRRDSEGELLGEGYLSYFLALTHINLYYSADEKAEKVTTWQFSQPTHEGYLTQADSYVMPTFTAVPSQAAEFAVFSSSDPSVAEIKDGKVTLKSNGKTTISADMTENSLFKADASLLPASYELTVSDSTSTAIESISADFPLSETYYDLHGHILDSANLHPGIYIRRIGDKAEKVIIR